MDDVSGGRWLRIVESDDEPDLDDTLPIDLAPLANQMRHATTTGKVPYLLFLDGMNMGGVVPIVQDAILLGKNETCDIILEDDGVSRVHAKIEMLDRNRLRIRDMGSTNGTFVNGKKIERIVIAAGEKILFGRRTLVQFVLWDHLDHQYKQELFAACPRDGLTGVYNRNYLKKRILAALSFAQRHGLPLTFMLIDIDGFKAINSEMGPQTGDQILVTLAQTMTQMVRTEDVFGRFGGDAFALLAIGLDPKGAQLLGERLRSKIESQTVTSVTSPAKIVKVTVSIGAGTHSDAKQKIGRKQLITTALDSLNNAREQGGNCVDVLLVEPDGN